MIWNIYNKKKIEEYDILELTNTNQFSSQYKRSDDKLEEKHRGDSFHNGQ